MKNLCNFCLMPALGANRGLRAPVPAAAGAIFYGGVRQPGAAPAARFFPLDQSGVFCEVWARDCASFCPSNRNTKNMQLFPKRLIEGRNRQGYTQTELAKKLGVHLRSIQNWEGGLTAPRGEDLRNLSTTLGMSVAFLLGMDEPGGKRTAYVPDSKGGEVRQRAHEYLDRMLDACHDDEDRERWTLVELKKKFPLPSSAVDAAAGEFLSGAGASGSHRGRASGRSRGAGGPSARTSAPARAAGMKTSKKP